MPFFDIFASPRWSPLRMRTKVASFFIFFQELSNKKKIKALRPKMTKIASRGGPAFKVALYKYLSVTKNDFVTQHRHILDLSGARLSWPESSGRAHLSLFSRRTNDGADCQSGCNGTHGRYGRRQVKRPIQGSAKAVLRPRPASTRACCLKNGCQEQKTENQERSCLEKNSLGIQKRIFWQTFSLAMDTSDDFLLFPAYIWIDNNVSTPELGEN